PVAVNNRITRCLDQPHVLQPDAAHLIRAPFGAAADVGLVLGQRADAGNGEQRLQFVDVSVPVDVDEVDDVVHMPLSSTARPSSFNLSRWARTVSCAAGTSAGLSPS